MPSACWQVEPCSSIGSHFERMCAISNLSEDLALPALDELISGRLLLETTQPGVVSEYTFTNDMLRDVVYTEAGDARRRLFHRRALEVLEKGGESAADWLTITHGCRAGTRGFPLQPGCRARSVASLSGE